MSRQITAKIHLAGALVGRVQKCVRCYTRMDSNDRWPKSEPVGWPVGPVLSDRNGMSSLSELEAQESTVRPCGGKV